ncbi:VOC family protein [Nocardioides sp.]|uniref:VOC family protein n=1 Tax=Nocardioides sp. TaxID=35761 RepID=UPI002ED3C22B
MRLHHVQLAIPAAGEDVARRFYVDGLGLTEVEKPEPLRDRGGLWLREPGVEVHLGVEEPFRPARKAHPALLLDDAAALDRTGARLEELGFEVDHTQRDTFPGYVRLHASDGHGNRVELLAPPE